jgi:hypothetical protein
MLLQDFLKNKSVTFIVLLYGILYIVYLHEESNTPAALELVSVCHLGP